MEPDDLLCSRNARPQKALVGRAQWKINQPPSLRVERAPEIRTVCYVVAVLHQSHQMVANPRSAAMKRTRRKHGAAFKAQVALASIKGDKTLAELAEQCSVHPTQSTEWTRHLLERVADVFGGTTHKPAAPDLKVLHAKIGPRARENDCLDGARTKAGWLSAKR